jgi:hypothetical protein
MMSDAPRQAVIDRPLFSSRLVLPLAWDRLDHAPTAEARERAAWSNAGVVRFLLHGIDVDAAMRPVDERLAEALAPLRIKLDMLAEMVGRLSYRDLDLPPAREIELSLDRIAWPAPAALPPGTWLCIKLYFHPIFLEPVLVHARVAHCVEDARDGGFRVQADLSEMPDAAGEAFARLAFLAQRRQLGERAAAAAGR